VVTAGDPAPELDSEALAAVISGFLGQFTDDQLEVAEEVGIRLNRLLRGFLEAEVLPRRREQPTSALTQRPSLPSSRVCCESTLMPWSDPTLPDLPSPRGLW
jgi:hypothetical protein